MQTYNDGVVSIYREKDRETDFNAKRNVTAYDDMEFVVKLAFGRNSKRQQDQEFAQQMGFSLTEKIHVRKCGRIEVDTKCKAVIDGYLYDVSYIDVDATDLYLYLEGVRKIGDA